MAAPPTRVSNLIPILVRLYPTDWRARYGDELTALLTDTALTPSTVLDVALTALDAHLSGDYPSATGDGRKVRQSMLNHLGPLAIVLGGAFLTVFIIVILALGSPDGPEGNAILTVLFYAVPFAFGILAVGIAGLALGRLAHDPVARGLGLVTSAFGVALAVAIFYLFFVGDVAWVGVSLLIPAFAASTGLLGVRMLTETRQARLQGVLLCAGLIAAIAWVVGWYLGEASAAVGVQETASLIQILGFGLLFLGWLAVGMLELRGTQTIEHPSGA